MSENKNPMQGFMEGLKGLLNAASQPKPEDTAPKPEDTASGDDAPSEVATIRHDTEFVTVSVGEYPSVGAAAEDHMDELGVSSGREWSIRSGGVLVSAAEPIKGGAKYFISQDRGTKGSR